MDFVSPVIGASKSKVLMRASLSFFEQQVQTVVTESIYAIANAPTNR